MFRLAHPEMLYGLVLPALFALAWLWSDRNARRKLHAFAGPRLADLLCADNIRHRQRIGRSALLLAGGLLVLGLARPQVGLLDRRDKTRGLDIMLVVDTSRSMAAQDDVPDRMGRVKRALGNLADRLAGNRLGLVQFAGTAFELCPLTQDLAAFKLVVHSLDTLSLPVPGTDVGGAITVALRALERGGQPGAQQRALVVLSDGENFGATPFPLVKRAAEQGVRTFCLGAGTPQGAPVLPLDPQTGSPPQPGAVTRLNEKNLSLLALFGAGTYARLTPGGREEEELAAELNRMEKSLLTASHTTSWDDQYPWLAGLAALLLIFDFLFSRRQPKTSSRAVKIALALLPCLGWLAGTEASAAGREQMQTGYKYFQERKYPAAETGFRQAVKADPDNARAEYDLGCSLLWQAKYAPACQAFTRAMQKTRSRQLLQAAWYNLGCASFYRGLGEGEAQYWIDAANSFKQVLLLNPDDAEARYNLELVLRQLQKRMQPLAQRETRSQGGSQGNQQGGGADRPGPEPKRSEGQAQDQAPPAEAQEKTKQRDAQGSRSTTSDDRLGKRQKGLSKEDAMRALHSLEANEQDLQRQRQKFQDPEEAYHGPYW